MIFWSVHSGERIPARCKIPELVMPSELPLILRPEDTSGGQLKEISPVDQILRWVEAVGYSLEEIDILVGRSTIKYLCQTPYHEERKWSMKLYRYKNTVCLDTVQIDGYIMPYGPPTYKWAAWSMVFEDLMKTGGEGTPGYKCQDMDVRMARLVELGSLKILSNGKVCCQTSGRYHSDLANCVEVKVRDVMGGIEPSSYDERKGKSSMAMNIWAQCVPLGIRTVYIGTRTADGDLTEINEFTMEELAQIGSEFWQSETILGFTNKLFTWLKENTSDGVTYTLANYGKGYLILRPVEEDELARKVQAHFSKD